MRARAGAENLAIGRRSCGSAVARVGDGADRWGLPVSVPQREGKAAPDERDPFVSDRVGREGTRAASARAEWSGPACGPISVHCAIAFSFSFCAVFDICLNLYNKLYANSKMMKIFV